MYEDEDEEKVALRSHRRRNVYYDNPGNCCTE